MPKFENTLSWNFLLAVLLAVASGGVVWGLTQAKLTELDAAIRTERDYRVAAMSRLEAEMTATRDAANQDRLAIARMQEQLAGISTVVNRMDVRLERLLGFDNRRDTP